MAKGHGKELNNQRGSATIEAVIGFTALLLAIFTILGLMNFCRTQMLVSAAVDTAAKEMAQYAYFYEMSGLQKFEKKVDDIAGVGKSNINQIIGTVDSLYSSINSAVDQTSQDSKNIANMLAAGDVELQTFENAIVGLENNAESVLLGINSVGNALKDIGNDPLLYMRSLVALIGSEGMEAAKRAVAVPLAKAFVSKHFGENTAEANAKLESLGIEGGLSSMNFNLSNIFSDDAHKDIEINVFYKVKLFQVFDWVVLEADVSKVAVCRAWLGGDDVIEKVTVPQSPTVETEPPSTEGEETDETTDPTESTDPTGATVETEENTAINSTGYWSLQHDPSGYYHSKRCEAFQKQFYEDYFIDRHGPYFSYVASDEKTIGYNFDVYAVWADDAYTTIGGNIRDPGKELLSVKIEAGVKGMAKKIHDSEGKVQEFEAYTHIVYIPENMPQDQYDALADDARAVKADMEALIANDTTGIPKDLRVEIVIVRAGGQYDYNSKESDYVHIGGVE